jgi:hypothetical protein
MNGFQKYQKRNSQWLFEIINIIRFVYEADAHGQLDKSENILGI